MDNKKIDGKLKRINHGIEIFRIINGEIMRSYIRKDKGEKL